MREFIVEKFNSNNSLVAVLEFDVDTLYLYVCNFINGTINIIESINIEFNQSDIVESDYELLWSDNKNIKLYYKGEIILDHNIK